jgi:ubiquinone/menaquinone biosynthesis C-methylase UbiE
MGYPEPDPAAPRRITERDAFIDTLVAGRRHSVLQLGCGDGEDGLAFVAAGINYVGLDRSEQNVHLARSRHLEAVVGTPAALPFADDKFDAAWAAGTLDEVPDTDVYVVLSELMRVLKPGGLLAVELCSGQDAGGLQGPRSDEMVLSLMEPHGDIRRFIAWEQPEARHQFLVVAKP